jgi:hypothetical protein
MIGRKYLVDNNALARLTREQRASEFFFSHCLLPAEVLYEARGFPDADQLGRLEYPTSGRVLRILGEVMATVQADDTSLVDLYANRGNADPMLVACALDGIREADDGLFGWEWIIVSNDNAVRTKAAEFGIETLLSDQFATVLDITN